MSIEELKTKHWLQVTSERHLISLEKAELHTNITLSFCIDILRDFNNISDKELWLVIKNKIQELEKLIEL